MAMPERPGIYRAEVTDAAAGRNKNDRWQIVFQFTLTQELDGEVWRSAPEDWTIRHWAQLQKTDGSINERNVEDLRKAFGWPGDDPFWFEDELANHGLPPVQLVIGWDDYNGKQTLRVKWINHHDHEGKSGNGELQHADPNDRRAALAEIGSQLRALAGGGAVATPARRSSTPPPPPDDEPPAPVTQDDVWVDWCEKAQAAGIPEKEYGDMYLAAIRDAKDPGQVGRDLSPKQWAKVDVLLAEALERREAVGAAQE